MAGTAVQAPRNLLRSSLSGSLEKKQPMRRAIVSASSQDPQASNAVQLPSVSRRELGLMLALAGVAGQVPEANAIQGMTAGRVPGFSKPDNGKELDSILVSVPRREM